MICSIDPGAAGAIAWLTDEGDLIEVADLPVAKIGGRSKLLPAVLVDMLGRRPVRLAIVEDVHTRPGEGAVGAFSFGRNLGQIEGALAGLGIGVTHVRPQAWKKHYGLSSDKDASRLRAIQLWPGAAGSFARKKDDGRAEAALIGAYGAQKLLLRQAVPAVPL